MRLEYPGVLGILRVIENRHLFIDLIARRSAGQRLGEFNLSSLDGLEPDSRRVGRSTPPAARDKVDHNTGCPLGGLDELPEPIPVDQSHEDQDK